MSEAARRERAFRQHWAVPGSGHDRWVKLAKIALPAAVGVLIAVLAMAPLSKDDEVSFILDKKKVDSAPERMRVETAHYVGQDKEGRRFEIAARSAVQRSSDVPLVDIEGLMARLGLSQGPVTIRANQGRYDMDAQKVAIDGPVHVVGPDDYRLRTSGVTVDFRERHLASAGQVSGEMRLGRFAAGRMSADLNNRTVVLDGGTRLKIVQGAVR